MFYYLSGLINKTTMKALFKVLDFYRDQDTNILTVDLDCNRCHIPLAQFEKWLDRTDT